MNSTVYATMGSGNRPTMGGLMSNLLERILDGLCDRLKSIEERHGYLSFMIESRLANEKMLQLEVMRLVSLMNEVDDYLPERPYSQGLGEKCDLWFRARGLDYWLEIKMRPTNYRKGEFHSKAIKGGIDAIIKDIIRLRKLVSAPALRFVLLAFYPMYPESYITFNRYHIRRLSDALRRNIQGPSRRIVMGDVSFDLYLAEV